MKKRFCAVLCIAAALVFAGCSGSNALQGYWKSGDTMLYLDDTDNAVLIRGAVITGKYKDEDSKIILSIMDDSISFTNPYTIQNGKLSVTFAGDDTETVFTRQKGWNNRKPVPKGEWVFQNDKSTVINEVYPFEKIIFSDENEGIITYMEGYDIYFTSTIYGESLAIETEIGNMLFPKAEVKGDLLYLHVKNDSGNAGVMVYKKQ